MTSTRKPSHWRIADALKIKFDDRTATMPAIAYDFPTMDESVMVWDSGILRDINNHSTSYKGWKVLWSLGVDKIDLTNANIYTEWHTRNDRAYIGYWYAREGTNDWKWGGRIFQKSADLRPWEWSGGLVHREGTPNTLDFF